MKTEQEEPTTISVEATAAAFAAAAAIAASTPSVGQPVPEQQLLALVVPALPALPLAAAAIAMTATASLDSNNTVAAVTATAASVPDDNGNDDSLTNQHHHPNDNNWKAHFAKLNNEKWINDSSGKQSGTYLCVCRHCHGQKIPFTGRYCRNHLKVCPVYQQQQTTTMSTSTTTPINTMMALAASTSSTTTSPASNNNNNTNNNNTNNKRKASMMTAVVPPPLQRVLVVPRKKGGVQPKKRSAAAALTRTHPNVDVAAVQQEQAQQKFIETLAVAHRIPDEPHLLLDLCQFLRPDLTMIAAESSSSSSSMMMIETLLPAQMAHRATMARANLSAQLQACGADGHALGCCLRPGGGGDQTTFCGAWIAGPAVLLEPMIIVTQVEKDGLHVAHAVDAFIKQYNHNYTVRFVTMPESRARRILAARHPHIMWIPCLERHLTLLVRESVLMSVTEHGGDDGHDHHHHHRLLTIFSTEAVVVEQTRTVYGRHVPTVPLHANDWGSLQGWLASRLRTRGAAEQYPPPPPHPVAVVPPPDYWDSLAVLERVIRPLCIAKYYLDDHDPNLSSVVLVLLFLHQNLSLASSLQPGGTKNDLGRHMIEQVEQLWSSLEQPLFFLAFALHPEYCKVAKRILDESLARHGSWRARRNALTVYRLLQASRFYHAKLQLPGSVGTLVADLQLWLNNDLQKLAMIEYRISDDPVTYWLRHTAETRELAALAILLLGARAHSMSPTTTSSRPNNKTYHQALIELDVMQQHRRGKSSQTGLRPPKRTVMISPRELPRIIGQQPRTVVANDQHRDDADSSPSSAFDDIAFGDSFESLWTNMTLVFDGREKIDPTAALMIHRQQPGVTGGDVEEDGPEMRMINEEELDPLNDLDDISAASIPEENAAYFATKSYCRNDKYPLAWLVESAGDLAFPEALTIGDDHCNI
jgi:hypothetical protein